MKRLTRVIAVIILGLSLTLIGGLWAMDGLGEPITSPEHSSTEPGIRTTPIPKRFAASAVSSLKNSAPTQDPTELKEEDVAVKNEKVDEKSSVVPFDSFLADVDLDNNGHQLDVAGALTLGKATSGADPLNEHVTVTIGAFSTMILKGSFKKVANGQFKFKRVVDCMFWDVGLKPLDKNKFELKLELESENKTSLVKPEQVAITIGDDGGSAKAYPKLAK